LTSGSVSAAAAIELCDEGRKFWAAAVGMSPHELLHRAARFLRLSRAGCGEMLAENGSKRSLPHEVSTRCDFAAQHLRKRGLDVRADAPGHGVVDGPAWMAGLHHGSHSLNDGCEG
jgi:hypothetical protein